MWYNVYTLNVLHAITCKVLRYNITKNAYFFILLYKYKYMYVYIVRLFILIIWRYSYELFQLHTRFIVAREILPPDSPITLGYISDVRCTALRNDVIEGGGENYDRVITANYISIYDCKK